MSAQINVFLLISVIFWLQYGQALVWDFSNHPSMQVWQKLCIQDIAVVGLTIIYKHILHSNYDDISSLISSYFISTLGTNSSFFISTLGTNSS